jgi:phospholipase/carboxylesterase
MSRFHTSYIPGDPSNPIILGLHGTGGDEHAFAQIIQDALPNHGYFGVRGKVTENGANRYFARFAEGQLDYEDLAFRTQELAEFLTQTSELLNQKVVALGYSNGANMAANLLLTNAFPLSGAILLRPMFLPTAREDLDLSMTRITINAGEYDTICPPNQAIKLAETFTNAGAQVELNVLPVDHHLTRADFEIIKRNSSLTA